MLKSVNIFINILLLSSLFLQAQQPSRVITETSRPSEKINKIFPFDIDLKNADGQVVNSSKLFKKNKRATVLLFWMTTCGPCRMELNAISSKFETWKKKTDFDFYAISIDFSDRVEQFNTRVKESKWPFPAYMDIHREFRSVMPGELNGLPQLFVLDHKGTVLYHTRRYMPGDEDKLFEALQKL
ncbi:MAG: TlpA family protein disulfide reductase [Saprospiraceae bacterium]|nr:TlpA family protein disulfide reductase [Saprospiraceae bacterium]